MVACIPGTQRDLEDVLCVSSSGSESRPYPAVRGPATREAEGQRLLFTTSIQSDIHSDRQDYFRFGKRGLNSLCLQVEGVKHYKYFAL